MKPTVILTAALLCALSPISFAKPLKVFILAGQSNMEGQGVVSMDGERDYNGGKGNLVWSMTNSKSAENPPAPGRAARGPQGSPRLTSANLRAAEYADKGLALDGG